MQVCDFDRPVTRNCYVVAGRFLFVQCSNPDLAELLERLFGGWQLSPVESDDQEPHLIISCYVNEDLPSVLPGADRFELAEQAHCYILEDGFYVDFESSMLRLLASRPVAIEVWFKSEPHSLAAGLARTMSFAVCAGLRRHGIFELHSAGLVAPGSDSGIVIIGPSGSGKSTLTTLLAASGWQYLSDDELLLTIEQDCVMARGFRNFFALSADSLAATGVSIDIAGSNVKTCFEPAAAFGHQRVETAIPRQLFFTSISGALETRVTELSQTETMMRLLRACPWATYDRGVAAEYLDVLSSLSRQAKGHDLVAGRDLLAPGYADKLLNTFITP